MIHTMKPKRKIDRSTDRRHETGKTKDRPGDNDGATVADDRRHIPDRRIGNIEVEWIDEEIEIR